MIVETQATRATSGAGAITSDAMQMVMPMRGLPRGRSPMLPAA